MVKRGTRRRRTLRGGGTVSYGFAPGSVDRTMNNPMAWATNSSGAPPHASAALAGGGLPGLSIGAGQSLQKGGGGGTHYGFAQGGGLFGGVTSMPTNCALPQSGGAGQLNVPQNAMAGGGRRSRSAHRGQRKNKRGTKKSKSKKLSRRR